MKILKILLGAFFALFLVFFLLNYFNNSARKKNKEKLEIKTLELDSLKTNFDSLTLYVKNLEESKQKVDTIVIYKEGKIKIVYRDVPVITKDTTKILIDSLRNDDLSLSWTITYAGKIFDFYPRWDITQKTIVKEHIVKVPDPYPVIRIVPTDKRELYISGEILYIEKPYLFVGFDYFDKKGMSFGGAVDPLNKVYKGRIGIRIFRF